MTINDIITEANLEGLLLNQLFQYPDGTWRAEWKLQLEDVCHWATSTGRGATAQEALLAARNSILVMQFPQAKHDQNRHISVDLSHLTLSDADLDELLAESRIT